MNKNDIEVDEIKSDGYIAVDRFNEKRQEYDQYAIITTERAAKTDNIGGLLEKPLGKSIYWTMVSDCGSGDKDILSAHDCRRLAKTLMDSGYCAHYRAADAADFLPVV